MTNLQHIKIFNFFYTLEDDKKQFYKKKHTKGIRSQKLEGTKKKFTNTVVF